MATATSALDLMLVPDVATEAGVPAWTVRRVIDRLGIAQRVGRVRVIARADLSLIVEELGRHGHLDQPATRRGLGAVASQNGQGPAGYHPGEALNCPRAARHSGVPERPGLEEPEAVRAINSTRE